jgi:hypothetical protein
VGSGAPAARQPSREATRAAEAPARAAGTTGGEEEKAGILHPEVGDCSPIAVSFTSVMA